MNNFIVNGNIVNPEDEILTQAILQEFYQKGTRPICACLLLSRSIFYFTTLTYLKKYE